MKIEFKKWDITWTTGFKPWWLPAEVSIGWQFRELNGAVAKPQWGYSSDWYDGQHHSIWLGWAYLYWLT